MLDSVQLLLNHYIDKVSRYKIHSIQMERGENPDDLYYLCDVDNKYYVVFESDYIGSLSDSLKEATEIFSKDYSPVYWLVKKSYQEETKESHIPIHTHTDIELLRKVLVLRRDDSPLKCVVIEFESNTSQAKRYHPNSYSRTS